MLAHLLSSAAFFLLSPLVLSSMLCHSAAGPARGAGHAAAAMDGTRQHTSQPIVTGTSVLGIKYKDGVMLAADTLASYGSLARYKNVERLKPVGECTLIGASGEYSDFQHIMETLEDYHQYDVNMDDGFERSPAEIYNLLRTIMYNRRNKFNPLWNYLLIAGCKKDGTAFLGSVDHIGTCYEDNILATGFGGHLALPILRKKWRPDLEEGEARALLEDCMRVLFYRDCRALNRIQIAKATAEGTVVSDAYKVDTEWSLASFSQPKAGQDTDGSW
ncbi:unnamed protein product [Ectocarpus sp. 13 AM-2016]